MKNFVEPHQNTIAQSLDYQTAQLALSTLQQAGFPPEQFSVMSQSLDPNSSIGETEAARGAGVGATTGGVFGGLVGALIAFASISPEFPLSFTHVIGLMLAGSGVGAAAMGVLGALTGANVHKGQKDAASNQQYILIADITPDKLEQAQTLLQEKGIYITPN